VKKQDVLVQVYKKDAVNSHTGTKARKLSKQQQQQQQQHISISDSNDKLV